jgi:chemotaxis protein MotB
MEDHLFFSNPKKTASSTILGAASGGEDAFLWGLADLLTLLLIFFIFLYSQSSAQSLSTAATKGISDAAIPEPPVHMASAPLTREAARPFQPLSIRPVMVHPPVDAQETIPSTVSPEPEIATPSQEDHKTASPEIFPSVKTPGPMDFLRQEALNAIQEDQNSSCSIRWNQNRLVFVLGERLTFPVGEAELLAGFYPTLERIARLIAAKKEYRVMVSGHTDDTPIATAMFPSNWELSAARAITVAKAIIESGVDPVRITVQGYGEFRPLHENSSPENREANRRVEIALFLEEDRGQASETLY